MQPETLWKWVAATLAVIVVVLLLCAFIMRPSDNGRYYFSVRNEVDVDDVARYVDVMALDTRTGVVWVRNVMIPRKGYHGDEERWHWMSIRDRRLIPWFQFGPRIPQVDNTSP